MRCGLSWPKVMSKSARAKLSCVSLRSSTSSTVFYLREDCTRFKSDSDDLLSSQLARSSLDDPDSTSAGWPNSFRDALILTRRISLSNSNSGSSLSGFSYFGNGTLPMTFTFATLSSLLPRNRLSWFVSSCSIFLALSWIWLTEANFLSIKVSFFCC